jgi:Tol biopolymer transport system component
MTERWSATERIFHAALERPAETRAAFLAEACGDDAELRREVESLLEGVSSTGFLEQPALQVAAGLVTSARRAPLTGQRLGVYSITALLGRGGMGEVYRARDTRLGREVAIKVLPPALTAHPDRLARFEREARVLASLNHPHIGMLYGLEESGGHLALVLELVEGDTLADRLGRGPIPLKEALSWARQIADALDAAHEKGIVHRDLKPANIKITPQDVIKVLDFGLARTYGAGSEAGVTAPPTITVEAGLIVGTAAYMSPEQARGQAVDRRADVWAFGCVLYELLTGRLAFAGATVPDTLAAVLHQEPDWTALPAGLPLSITTLLRRCLEKDVRQRRRDIGDIRAEVDDALARPGQAAPSAAHEPVAEPRRGLRLALAAAVVIAAAAAGAGARQWVLGPPTAPSAAPSLMDARPTPKLKRMTDAIGIEEAAAVSPNGKDLAFVASDLAGHRQIWIRRLAGGNAIQITTDAVDHEYPRWTPDSEAIVYFTPAEKEDEAGKLYDIRAYGGSPRGLAPSSTGADVGRDGRLATFQKTAAGMALVILAPDGTSTGETISIERNALEYSPPRWSPDQRSIAFYLGVPIAISELFVVDVANRERHLLSNRQTHMKGLTWLPDGSGLVFASSEGSTMVYPPVFNLRWVSRDGTREQQLTIGDVSYEQPDIVQTSQLFATKVSTKSEIWRFPVTGSPLDNVRKATQITRQTGQVQTPSVSADGTEVAYLSDSGGHSNVWVARIDGSGNPRQLTTETNDRMAVGIPIWSPLDDRIAYITTERGTPASNTQWIIKRDSSDRRPLVKGSAAAWSANGQSLYYHSGAPSCIYKTRADGSGEPEQVRCNAAIPAPAGDGTLYFVRDSPSATEIYKAKPEGDERAVLVTRYPASRVPLWPTGFTLSPDERWLAVPLRDNGTTNIWAVSTSSGVYRQITDFGRRPILIARQVSWSRDGKFIYAAVAESDSDIVLLENLTIAR